MKITALKTFLVPPRWLFLKVETDEGSVGWGEPVLMSAISGIDMALWDIKGRFYNAPVHALMSGAVRNKIRSYCWIGGDRPGGFDRRS